MGVAIVVRGAECLREVVIGVCVPVCLVVVVLGHAYELPELADPVGPAFEPLVLVCFVSLVCEPFALTSISIRLPFLSGSVVLAIGVVAAFGWFCVVLLALVLVGIGFRGGLGLSWSDRGCGCALFCLGYVVVVIQVRVTAIAVTSHVGLASFGCGILKVLNRCPSCAIGCDYVEYNK
jgi:hypothetical protein